VASLTALAVAATVAYIFGFARQRPPTVATASANVTMQTVGQLGNGPKADWVSYLVRNADGRWERSTIFDVPAHATVHFTILQYDNPTPPRNPFWGKVLGTQGGTVQVDGRTVSTLNPATEIAHTFSIANLGVFVPLAAVPNSAKNTCSVAPCSPDQAHRTVTFTIKTGAPGTYRWQCMIPCAAGFAMGWGGPMQTIGYMDGLMKVV
jgi:heme/copper-type cytochrome/quinol oxidase subunit 2